MFRLTAVLLVALYAVMSIWGEPPKSDVVVARADTGSPAVPALGAAMPVATPPPEEPAELSDLSEREALEMALAAGEATKPPVTAAAATVVEPQEEVELWYVTGSRVNLRAGPSADSAIVGGVSLGDRAEVLSDPSDSWIRIRTQAGVEAWIYGRFLSETPA